MADWQNLLSQKLPKADIGFKIPMHTLTSMKVGGPADAVLSAANTQQIIEAVAFCREENIPCMVMGCGSNMIVRDGGIRGLVIHIGRNMSICQIRGTKAVVDAGCKLPMLAREAMQKKLAGLECVGGIPGSVGGAIYMNAGAYGGEIRQTLQSITYIDKDLQVCSYTPKDNDFGYRSSIFMKNQWLITRAEFALHYDTSGEGRIRYDECNQLRKKKQPLNFPSSGSIFKRPDGYYAGQLIEHAGLKGTAVGGASVSQLHAGFIINHDHATASDVLELIALIQSRVLETSGIMLEPEVKILGVDLIQQEQGV